MKFFYLFIILLSCSSCSAGKKFLPDLNLFKNEAKEQSALKGEVNGNIEIAPVKAPIHAKVEAQAQMQAPVGANNQATNVGRDSKSITHIVNDSKAMQSNNNNWYLICVALVLGWFRAEWRNSTLLKMVIRQQQRHIDGLEKIVAGRKND